jgi:hypothetical protein
MLREGVVALVLAVAVGVIVSQGLDPAIAWFVRGLQLQGAPRRLPTSTVHLVSVGCGALVFLWWVSTSRRTVVRRRRP